jgi:7,8-dihydropterin-6-yl-methyl-4-(beta-D-ribofuranosyl)aminobenzene 5'-phosphate synthase
MDKSLSFEIKIIVEEKSKPDKKFLTEVGFSALILNGFNENRILFDTGASFKTLKNNLEQMEEKISDINKLVISHNHEDHIGGFNGLYESNPELDIYVPAEISKNFHHSYKRAKIHGVSGQMEIDKNMFSTGQLGNYLKEQSLFLRTSDGNGIILVGCGHPGLEDIIIRAKERFSHLEAIIGGFHHFRKYPFLSNIDIIGPCHCTKHLNDISKRFPKNYEEIFVGKTFRF